MWEIFNLTPEVLLHFHSFGGVSSQFPLPTGSQRKLDGVYPFMSLTRVEQSLILATYFRGNHPDRVHWSSSCDQVITLSLFYTGDISEDECARRFSNKSYVGALYDNDGELTAEIRSRYQDLLTLLRAHPDLIRRGGNLDLPADPTYTACRLTAEGDRMIPSLIGLFPNKPEFPHWPDTRE